MKIIIIVEDQTAQQLRDALLAADATLAPLVSFAGDVLAASSVAFVCMMTFYLGVQLIRKGLK